MRRADSGRKTQTFEEVITESNRRSEVLCDDAMLVETGDNEQLHSEARDFLLEDLAPKCIPTESLISTDHGMHCCAAQAGETHTFENVITRSQPPTL